MLDKSPGLIFLLPSLCNAYGYLTIALLSLTPTFGITKKEFGNCLLSRLIIRLIDGTKDQSTTHQLPNGIDLPIKNCNYLNIINSINLNIPIHIKLFLNKVIFLFIIFISWQIKKIIKIMQKCLSSALS